MARIRLLPAVCCLALAGFASAQSGYFQTLVKEAKSRIREIDVSQFQALRSQTPAPVVVDVREDNEWNQSRIPGAIHVGRGVLEPAIETKVPEKSAAVIVYCRSGGRSAVAADVLQKMGYTNVRSLAGGITAYQAAGLPVEQGSR
ncbi:MAG: rhodanese-like domain-containing protein [Acidobacteriota bacterium]